MKTLGTPWLEQYSPAFPSHEPSGYLQSVGNNHLGAQKYTELQDQFTTVGQLPAQSRTSLTGIFGGESKARNVTFAGPSGSPPIVTCFLGPRKRKVPGHCSPVTYSRLIPVTRSTSDSGGIIACFWAKAGDFGGDWPHSLLVAFKGEKYVRPTIEVEEEICPLT